MTNASPIEAEYLDSIVSTVWESLFGEPTVATPASPAPPDSVRAQVDIRGSWSGSVVVSCTRDVASGLTRDLLALPADLPPAPDEVRDALGEIANIVAGNVKSLLPDHATLGLPEVHQDGSAEPSGPDTVAATYLATAGNLRVAVTTLEDPR